MSVISRIAGARIGSYPIAGGEFPSLVCSDIFTGGSGMQFLSGGVVFTYRQRAPDLAGLASFVDVGPFRYAEQKQADETSMISSLLVGLAHKELAVDESHDYEEETGTEDWLLADDEVDDWGIGAGVPDVFSLELMATDDGVQPQYQGVENLTVTVDRGGIKQYSPTGISAIMHRMKFSATEIDEKFALKTIDIAGSLTGRAL